MGDDAPGIIKANSDSKVSLPPPHDEFTQAIADRFKDIDQDADGFLSRHEIDEALGRQDIKGHQGAMVATIKKYLGDFEDLHDDEIGIENDGITLSDVTELDRLREAHSGPGDQMDSIHKIQVMYKFAKDKINTTSPTLFPGDPDPMQVQQGLIGDCWFLSALVAVINRDKNEIKKWIKPSADNFHVKFPGDSRVEPITRPTDGELAIFATVGANGLWLPVLEKAYGLAMNRSAYFFVETSTTDAMDSGEALSKGIEIMTGHSTDSDTLSFTKTSTTRKKLIDAFANKKIVTAGIRPGLPFTNDLRDNGLPMGHAYTVLNYDAAKDVLRLRNPWGNTGPKGVKVSKGAFDMSMGDFEKNFSDICYEE